MEWRAERITDVTYLNLTDDQLAQIAFIADIRATIDMLYLERLNHQRHVRDAKKQLGVRGDYLQLMCRKLTIGFDLPSAEQQ